MNQKRLVIDANVYIQYSINGQLRRLVSSIIIHNLEVFINGTLLAEIFNALHNKKLLKTKKYTAYDAIDIIRMVTTDIPVISRFLLSPDLKDNYLFDIALQNSCTILITEETRLLNFNQSPVEIHNIKWFKENFPDVS